tara:strand:+ start:4458 stop:5498 length:1041 start_codon:yes stop_codon:yes gene_type:complete
MDTNVAYDQQLLDLVFADLDDLLAAERPVACESRSTCLDCGGSQLSYAGSGTSHPGSLVCDCCGVVQPGIVFYETMYGNDVVRKSSNYKRIHHWHERISQLLLMESQIPHDQMLAIAEKLCDGTYTVLNKDTVRSVLRSLNMQLYIEKWLQIIFRVTRIAPPIPGNILVYKLDEMFQALQEPFNCFCVAKRKNFLNYNYVFCRLFQRLDCTQFCMFFPLIKSKQKLKQLDDMWNLMADSLNWELKPLESVAPFAVRLEKPDLLLQRLASEYVPPVPAEIQIEPLRMVFQTLDRRSVDKLIRVTTRHRSSPLEQEPQTTVVAAKRPRSSAAKGPRLQSQQRYRARHV